ncbi:MAG: hypothetical protein ACT4OF_15215 [Caulobacteraceae bacterium]
MRWSYRHQLKRRNDLLALQTREQLFHEQFHTFWGISQSLLVWGQSLLVLDGDAKAAKAAFSELTDWMPFFDRSVLGPLRGRMERDGPRIATQFDPYLLVAPVVCLTLAGDRVSLRRLASVDKQRALAPPSKFIKMMRPWREFSFALLDLLADDPKSALRRRLTPDKAPGEVADYDRMIAAISTDDAAKFEQAPRRPRRPFRNGQSARKPRSIGMAKAKLHRRRPLTR